MAVTDLGNHNVFAQSNSITCASAVSAGTLVVGFIFDGGTTITGATLSDSKSNTYTLLTSQNNTVMYYSFITTPLTTSDTITYNVTTGVNATLNMAMSSVPGYNALDTATTNTNANGFAASYSVTGAGPAAVTNEIYFGFVFTNGTLSGTPTGWTATGISTPNASGFLAMWQINSGTSALTYNGNLTGGQNAWSLISSFKPTVVPLPTFNKWSEGTFNLDIVSYG